MQPQVVARLRLLNQQFYQTFAVQFSATRRRIQPGVQRILNDLPLTAHLLDLGCGNGEFARRLERRAFQGSYLGVDISPGLLEDAQRLLPFSFPAHFIQGDFTEPDWQGFLSQASLAADFQFDAVLAFASLHHIPSRQLHLQILHQLHQMLVPHGVFIHSQWQFLNSPRLAGRIQPWEAIGLSSQDVEPGDYLLDWRAGGQGLRYVHHFSMEELAWLAAQTGFEIQETFSSDGDNGQLGLYQTWRKQT